MQQSKRKSVVTDKALGLSLDERLVAVFDEATLDTHDKPERAVGDESCNMSEPRFNRFGWWLLSHHARAMPRKPTAARRRTFCAESQRNRSICGRSQ